MVLVSPGSERVKPYHVDSYEEKAIAGLKSLTSWWWNARP